MEGAILYFPQVTTLGVLARGLDTHSNNLARIGNGAIPIVPGGAGWFKNIPEPVLTDSFISSFMQNDKQSQNLKQLLSP